MSQVSMLILQGAMLKRWWCAWSIKYFSILFRFFCQAQVSGNFTGFSRPSGPVALVSAWPEPKCHRRTDIWGVPSCATISCLYIYFIYCRCIIWSKDALCKQHRRHSVCPVGLVQLLVKHVLCYPIKLKRTTWHRPSPVRQPAAIHGK